MAAATCSQSQRSHPRRSTRGATNNDGSATRPVITMSAFMSSACSDGVRAEVGVRRHDLAVVSKWAAVLQRGSIVVNPTHDIVARHDRHPPGLQAQFAEKLSRARTAAIGLAAPMLVIMRRSWRAAIGSSVLKRCSSLGS